MDETSSVCYDKGGKSVDRGKRGPSCPIFLACLVEFDVSRSQPGLLCDDGTVFQQKMAIAMAIAMAIPRQNHIHAVRGYG